MTVGTLLVLIAVILAVASLVVRQHSFNLLAAAVISGFLGVLLGAASLLVVA